MHSPFAQNCCTFGGVGAGAGAEAELGVGFGVRAGGLG